ncbi:MAG: isoprenyl transferase [Deltaproteobacteria bacterium]|nr:isoprenyl transferase [Deltaproteobacteria bacterium]
MNLPEHIAIIMDGNGRWAKARSLPRVEGHRMGVIRSEEIITAASRIGLSVLTLYAFSKENWQRPKDEVEALMKLLQNFLLEKREKMLKNGIRLQTIGDTDKLPAGVRKTLDDVRYHTSVGKGMILNLALSYGGRDEIIRAIRKVAEETLQKGGLPQGFGEESFGATLDTASLPNPDLVIRTSGEHRVSNFLLWQAAYAEYFFEECNWPDFTEQRFLEVIEEYQQRERRFGMTSEQLK